MKKRWFGYAAWLLLTACLYFFENNTGTRAVLIGSLLLPLIPPLRAAFFSPDSGEKKESPTVSPAVLNAPDLPGGVQPYQLGDPVRLIHWKLSAKKGETLVRKPEDSPEPGEKEVPHSPEADGEARKRGLSPAFWCIPAFFLCLALLFLTPEASRGAQALCNRLFAASEAVNAYAYARFPVPESQNVFPAAVLLICMALSCLAFALLSRGRLPALALMAACALLQAYFGLSLPAWVQVPLAGLMGLRMMRKPLRPRDLTAFCAAVLTVCLLTGFLLPGRSEATEAASEAVRDRLSLLAGSPEETFLELPAGLTETRHVRPLSMETGSRPARTQREYRLLTLGERQISMPDWTSWLKAALLLSLAVLLVVLPYAPFLVLNARKKRAQEIRRSFSSDDVAKAVSAIFQQTVSWLEEGGFKTGNLLYRDLADRLPAFLPEGYAGRFAACVKDYEEAVYSSHPLPEEKRVSALQLLAETETALWNAAGFRERLRLKYWECLCP